MRHPYQCIHFCNSQAAENSKGILVAAAGPSLFVFNLLNGSILYQWSTGDAKLLESDKLENTQKPLESIQELPSHNCSTNRDQHVGNQKIKQINITKITSSLDGQHIVISTDLDKCIRVFQALSRNEFCLLSERNVPKRPCEIALTPDEADILCGDKFGDVYSLPLLEEDLDPEAATVETYKAQEEAMASSFIPSANEFTVHTARNRETLRSQLRAKTETNQRKAPLLNLKPVLGHVSMLTDVKSVSITSEKDSGQHQKTYIITADRDEHIRVSRGPPQSYIIETFCQGHTQFISRLCVPSWDSHILFSGGGESCVFVWDWLHGKVIQKANVHQHLPEIQATSINDSASSDISRVQLHSPHTIQPQKDESQEPVSFILAVPAFSSPSSPSSSFPTAADEPADIHQVVIGFEGIAAVFIYRWDGDAGLRHGQTIELLGNVLDATCGFDGRSIIVSIDNVHVKGSTNLFNNQPDEDRLLQIFRKEETGGRWTEDVGDIESSVNEHGSVLVPGVLEESRNGKSILSELLYTYEAIRKPDREPAE